MNLQRIGQISLDSFISELANIDKDLAEVSTNIKLFMDKGKINKIAIQISWNSEDRFFILNEKMNVVLEESYGVFSKSHPVLDDIIEKYLGQQVTNKKVQSLASKRIKLTQRSVTKDSIFTKAISSLRRVTA